MVGKTRCAVCTKENAILKCVGCQQTFCSKHVQLHRDELSRQLANIEMTCDLIRGSFIEQTNGLKEHPLIQEINQWEEESIEEIRKLAEENRKEVCEHTIGRMVEIEEKLNELADEIRKNRLENDFFETDLSRLKEDLSELEEKLRVKPTNIQLRYHSTPFLSKISVDISDESETKVLPSQEKRFRTLVPQLSLPFAINHIKWFTNGQTIAGGHGSGHQANQLFNPLSLCIDEEMNHQRFYIADHWNNRIVNWESGALNGTIELDGRLETNPTDQLKCPKDIIYDRKSKSLFVCDLGNRQVVQYSCSNGMKRKTVISNIDCWGLAMDSQGYLYVSDYNKHHVQRWRIGDSEGEIVAGGNGSGSGLDQLNSPTHIFVDDEQSVYISDRLNHRVIKWKSKATKGTVVAGNQTEGKNLRQLSNPAGILVDRFGNVYVADSNNHRVMCWPKRATKGSIAVAGNGHGDHPDQLFHPWGLCLDQENNLYVADNANHRIQKFLAY